MTEENNFLLMRERDSELVIRISGTWRLQDGLPSMDGVKKEIERPPHARLVLFDTRELAGWDSSVVWFLTPKPKRSLRTVILRSFWPIHETRRCIDF